MPTEPQPPSLISDDMRRAIGARSEPWQCEVEKSAIRMFARAVGHTAPVFYDEAAAREAGYRSLPCPPGFLGLPVYHPSNEGLPHYGGPLTPEPASPLTRGLNGGTQVQYFDDICAGDVLTARSRIVSFEEREGRLGPMLITTTEIEYTNQSGKLVAILTRTGIRY